MDRERDLIELARFVRQALDEHERRISDLEVQRAPLWRASLRDGVRQRRRVVVELRESGLSIAQIAMATGAGRSTVQKDLDAVPHSPPAYIRGIDGKLQPSTHRNGARAGA